MMMIHLGPNSQRSFLCKFIKGKPMSQYGAAHDCNECENHICNSFNATPSVSQTLDELDFERGIWNAALTGSNDDVERKLKQSGGSGVNQVDGSGYTALHYACRSGHVQTCKTLLAYRADVNATTQSSKATPLHRAAYMGHSEIISLLLQNKADPACIDCDGMTPLHKAVEQGHIETIQILLKAQPEVTNIKDNKSRQPIDLAKSEAVRTAFIL